MRIIGGLLKGRSLVVPKGAVLRPTTGRLRETVFNILQNGIEEARVLDLFAGVGAIGIEALSRGAAFSTFVDADKFATRAIKESLQQFQMEDKALIFCSDVFEAISRLAKKKQQFDLIYIDPPYGVKGEALSEKALRAIDQADLLAIGGTCFLEEDAVAVEEMTSLTHLQLKSERRAGRSILREYTR